MISKKYYSKWLKEAGRGHVSTFLSWGTFIVWMITTLIGISGDTSSYFYGIGNEDLLFLSAGLGIGIGILEFMYLFQVKKLDFYYSLPVKKMTIFWTRYIHGILQFFVPFIFTQFICTVYEIQCDKTFLTYAGGYAGRNILVFGLSFLLFYHIMILGIVAAGKITSAIWIVGTILVYAALFIHVVLDGFVKIVFESFYRIPFLEELGKYLIPPELVPELSGRELYHHIAAWEYTPQNRMVVVILLWIVVLFGVILLIWKRRKTEMTGWFFVCPGVERVMEILMSVLSGSVVATVFLKILRNKEISFVIQCMILCAIGIIIVVIVHFLIESLLLLSKKNILRRKIQLMAESIVVILVTAGFFGMSKPFDGYKPDVSELESVAICVNGLDVAQDTYTIMKDGRQNYETDDRLLEYVLKNEGMEAGLNWLGSLKKMKDDEEITTVTVCYYLKDGARKYRSYPVTLAELDSFASVYETTEYKEKTYPLLASEPLEKEMLTWSDGVISEPLKLTGEEKNELLAAYQKDVREMEMKELKDGFPIGRLTVDSEISGMQTNAFIYPFFYNTKKVLESYGIEVGKELKDYPMISAKVEQTSGVEGVIVGGSTQKFYEDEKELREWSEKLIPDVFAVQPLFCPADLSVEAEVQVEDMETNSVIDVECYGRK